MHDRTIHVNAAGCWLLLYLFAILIGSTGPALAHDDDPHVCGNGVREAEEECDDGNLIENDGCDNDCTVGLCEGTSYDTTFEAISDVVFDGYSCSDGVCHGAGSPSGGLNFQSETLHADLVGVPSNLNPSVNRVTRLDPETSLLYLKLAAGTNETELDPNLGGVMPPVGQSPALSDAHLSAMYEWIRYGAPEAGVVEGTQHLLDACLPEPDPIMIPDVDPPDAGVGIQWRSTPMPTLSASETETCMITYYDYTGTDLVPEEATLPCPSGFATLSACVDPLDYCEPDDADCAPNVDPASVTGIECESDDQCEAGNICVFLRGGNNPGGQCFGYDRITVAQEAMSHHFVLNVYAGRYGPEHESWGAFSRRVRDTESEEQGQACDPKDIDLALGVNSGCSSAPRECIAGIGYGPADYSNYLSFFGDDSNAPRLLITQEPFTDFEYYDGAYNVLPMAGIVVHNSHRFNLTSQDATVEAFINLEFAMEEDQQHEVRGVFDASAVWVQNVPPYETREYCNSYTLEQGTRLFHLTSHQHRTGNLFRIWGPPNDPCRVDCSEVTGAGAFLCSGGDLPLCEPREDDPIYYNTDYQDPVQLWFDEPLEFDIESAADRTFLYCGVYDNGSTATSPAVKRQSTSASAPVVDDLVGAFLQSVGGPCPNTTVQCIADPENPDDPNRGVLCDGDDDNCFEVDGVPGVCDACPVTGGLTTDDEMFILLGDFFVVKAVPEPGAAVGLLAAMTTLSVLRARRGTAGFRTAGGRRRTQAGPRPSRKPRK